MDVQTRSPLRRSIPFPSPHSVPSVGFGFNLAPGLPLASSSSAPLPTPARQPAASAKRRHEADPDGEDERMSARSPSPMERPKKALTKRLRGDNPKPLPANGKQPAETPDSVDLGLLLASLPPASLLTILTSLITKHPGLKQLVLPLIPRPTLEAAVQAVNDAARKLRDAHPYSQPTPAPVGLSFGFGSAVPGRPALPAFGSTPNAPSKNVGGGVRDEYVRSRLRPIVAEFASTARSYLTYFSSIPQRQSTPPTASSSSSTPPAAPPEMAHPSEVFTYLNTLTQHTLRMSSIARNLLLEDTLITVLQLEWVAWLSRIDTHINQAGGIYGAEVARTWQRGLEEMVHLEDGNLASQSVKAGSSRSSPSKGTGGFQLDRPMRSLRDAWVAKVGWLIGRRPVEHFGMDEDEDEEL